MHSIPFQFVKICTGTLKFLQGGVVTLGKVAKIYRTLSLIALHITFCQNWSNV